MHKSPFMETVRNICTKNPAYEAEAYLFTQEALESTVKSLKKKQVSGQELLEGIRRHALKELGPMALTVLHDWGVRHTEDFGNIVFSLVEAGKLGKTDEDDIRHFASGYDFDETFGKPFRPTGKVWSKKTGHLPARKSSNAVPGKKSVPSKRKPI